MFSKVIRPVYLTLLVMCWGPVVTLFLLPLAYTCSPAYGVNCPDAPDWLVLVAAYSLLTVVPALILAVIAIIDTGFWTTRHLLQHRRQHP